MIVLSLFDGMSCGRVALDGLNIPVTRYYASEIDPHAIKVGQTLYPDSIPLGCIKGWRDWDIDFSKVDLILAGFPCQSWSIMGAQSGDSDPRGALIHDLIDIWKQCKPGVKFLFENVKMSKVFVDYINLLFNTTPVLIDSDLVSAQKRKRYYWTNIADVKQPDDKRVCLLDVLDENHLPGQQHNTSIYHNSIKKAYCLTVMYYKASPSNSCEKSQRTMVITREGSEGEPRHYRGYIYRLLSPTECCKLQTIPDDKIEKIINSGVPKDAIRKMTGNGWTIDIIKHILKDLKPMINPDHAFPSKFTPREEYPWNSDYTYDIECYPNLFTLSAKHVISGQRYFFEISEWVNDGEHLLAWLHWLIQNNCRMIGFNNVGYDYPLLHHVFKRLPDITYQEIYEKSSWFFTATQDEKWNATIWESDYIIRQLDLYKIHHFDNAAKRTSLKVLEVNMRSENVRDLPIKPNTVLTYDQRCELNSYNDHDVDETEKFLLYSVPEIKLREQMTETYGQSFMNYNDTKLGEKVFEIKLKDAGLDIKGRTYRSSITVADILFPIINFRDPELNRVHEMFKNLVVTDTKGVKFPSARFGGIDFVFGLGGLHASMESQIVSDDDEYEIIDADVTSFYPSIAIVNGLYPAHLGPAFCDIYGGLKSDRVNYAKGTPENAALKLALNGAYGKSNSEFSCFYDPQFTMAITINGQLMLAMLSEWLLDIPDLTMIQANTDGVTFKVKRSDRERVMQICQQWEVLTKLDLEYAYYSKMAIRDVNNYIAVTTDGKLKNKSAYEHSKLGWHKNHSALVVPMAAEHALINDGDIRSFIMSHRDPFDFMLKTKVPRSSSLVSRKPMYIDGTEVMSKDTVLQNITRYYVAVEGGKLFKIMPPTKPQIDKWRNGDHYKHEVTGAYEVKNPGQKPSSGKYKLVPPIDRREIPDRNIGIDTQWYAADCNHADDFNWENLNYEYYISEAHKLVDPLL